MKLAFVNYHQNTVSRGLETYVSELSQRLSQNHEVKVYSSAQKMPNTRSPLTLLQRFFIDPASLKIAFWTASILSDLNRFQPDFVFALNGGWQVLILRLWTLIHKKKLIISAQSGPGWDDRFNLLICPDIFVCLTHAQINWAKRVFHFPHTRLVLIPNGVDLTVFSKEGEKNNLDLPKPIIITVGAAETSKNLDLTVKAVAKLKKTSLLILGTGPLEAKIDTLGAKLLGERYRRLSVSHDQVPHFLRSADLFTLCSASSEAFGIVYLEALAIGLAVVATKDASRREIIGRAGILINHPENSSVYARALEAALSKRWGNLPRQQAKNYDWDKITVAYENLCLRPS